MAYINRIGFTELAGSEYTGSGRRGSGRVKYGKLESVERKMLLTYDSIIFIHGLRGHPYKTWTGSHHRDHQHVVGASSRLQHIRSLFRSSTPRAEGHSAHASTSTRQEKVFWPQDYLAEDVPQARVWTYGYDADVIGGLFRASGKDSVSQHGRNLAVRLEREVENKVIVSYQGLGALR